MDEWPSTRASLLIRLRDPSDERAWAEFVEIYTPLVRRVALRKGLQDADADDLAQDVFRSVARAIERWNPDPDRGSFRGWLFKIAHNLIINLLAGQACNTRGVGGIGIDRLLEAQPAPDDEHSAIFELEYRRRLFCWSVEQVRGEVNEATWQAFWRTAVDGQKPKDVAEALGMSLGSVYVSKNRVMARVRQKILRISDQ
jgi:RNA polymerase sigma factor (sigma-70 family)